MSTTIDIDLAGAPARLTSSFDEFTEYAAVHLDPLRTPSAGQPVVWATLRWHEGPVPRARLAARPSLDQMERVDRDLYRGDGRLAWFRIDELPDLHLWFRWDGERLHVEGDFFHRLSADPRRDRVKRWVYRRRLDGLRRRRFTTLLYYLVYYPCFWWLERQRDTHPIHAAGVELGDGIVVLAGASGVGKSTLAAGLALGHGARMLSDTFVLHRGTSVFPVREPLLIDARSQAWLGADLGRLRPIEWRYCLRRAGFHWPAEGVSNGGPARLLLFPQQAATPYVRRMTPAQAQGRLRAGDLIVNDLRRYWAYAAALEMLDPRPVASAREESAAALVAAVPSYELGLTTTVERQQIAGELEALMATGRVPPGRRTGDGASPMR